MKIICLNLVSETNQWVIWPRDYWSPSHNNRPCLWFRNNERGEERDPVLVHPVWFSWLIAIWWRRMALKHLVNFGTCIGLPPNRHQAIPRTDTDILSTGPSVTEFCEIWINWISIQEITDENIVFDITTNLFWLELISTESQWTLTITL